MSYPSIAYGIFSGIVSNIREGIMTEAKIKQNRIRRMAERQGLALQLSRRRDPRAKDYGQVWLCWLDAPTPERSNDAWVGPFDSLDDVEFLLTSDIDKLPGRLYDVGNVERYLAARSDG
jgi:hypothetical protein